MRGFLKHLFFIFLTVMGFALAGMGQTTQTGTTVSSPAVPAPAQTDKKPAPAVQAPDAEISLSDLPLPSMKNIITTEKTVPSIPTGVIPRAKVEAPASQTVTPVQPADQSNAAADSPAPAQTQTAGAGSAGTASLPGVPVGSALPQIPAPGAKAGTAGADSTALAVVPPQKQQPQQSEAPKPAPAKKKTSDTYREEISLFNVPTANLRTMKAIIDDKYDLVGMVYGEERGFIRILTSDDQGNFTETWKSPPLNSAVRGIFVENLDHAGEAEIVAYTADGNIFIYGFDTHDLKYRTPEGTYQGIKCMSIFNLDNTPEQEILFITSEGKLVQFDPKTKFEEWKSSDIYLATDMVIGNVDNDKDPEIILNTGEILNSRFKTVKWKTDVKFGERLYLIDIDDDGILELVTEYEEQYVRIFDVDQRREKW